jgi:hypothetical protein
MASFFSPAIYTARPPVACNIRFLLFGTLHHQCCCRHYQYTLLQFAATNHGIESGVDILENSQACKFYTPPVPLWTAAHQLHQTDLSDTRDSTVFLSKENHIGKGIYTRLCIDLAGVSCNSIGK